MRIGCVFEWNNNIRYRVLNPMKALERRGHEVVFGRTRHDAPLDVAQLRRCDVIHAYRLLERDDWKAVEGLVRRGAALVWDTDDNLSDVPREADYYARSGGLAALRDTHRITVAYARAAHLVTVSTDRLAENYRRAGVERVDVLGNYLARDEASIRGRKHDGLTVGWIAGTEHAAELSRVPIVDALERLAAARSEVNIESIGVNLGLTTPKYRHIPSAPMDRFLEMARSWDIGLAVLADIPFNRSRSDVKVKEYASLGMPWLASPIGPYAGLGEREGGRLVEDADWGQALDRLAGSRFDRIKLSRRGKAWAKSQVVDARVHLWEAALEEAIERADAARARGRSVTRQ